MDRMRRLFRPRRAYQPIEEQRDDQLESEDGPTADSRKGRPFSLVEYWIFLLLGVAMLWAWNMFLAAAPYFQQRFASHDWILTHFQSAEISVATGTNLLSTLTFAKMQKNASYPFRIVSSLCIFVVSSVLLALSTLTTASAGVYFGFLMLIVFCSSLAAGMMMNGLFSYVAPFGRSEYTQAIMTGQGVAGVLPCLAQIASVLAVPGDDEQPASGTPAQSSKSALAFFSAATFVSIVSLVAFVYLHRRNANRPLPQSDENTFTETENLDESLAESGHPHPPLSSSTKSGEHKFKPVGLVHLFFKLPSLSTAIFLCFAITMVFPVFTSTILSLHPATFPAALFIPTAFLIWNIGDLLGRVLTLVRFVRLTHFPLALLCLSVGRLIFIPLYLLCNVHGEGAVVRSDAFYLIVVQLLFGLSNGYLGSSCMMGAGDWVADQEKEATGAFMSFCLVAGLTVGSLLSFLVA